MNSAPHVEPARRRERRGVRVRGVVQGVGFRPAMLRWALRCTLGGFVLNDDEGVWIEIEGDERAVLDFITGLRDAAPEHARIASVDVVPLRLSGETSFRIDPSRADDTRTSGGRARIAPDLAPCAECLAELESPGDRRHQYPFLACTHCGPRLSVVHALPYDRTRTTMAPFPLCERCRREYEAPEDRRFHAQAIACPTCGPRVRLVRAGEPSLEGDLAVAAAVHALDRGAIVAVKGAGGFALAVDATNEPAVARLRARKRRPDKPFAVMARSLDHAERAAHLDDAARRALASPARPIVLVPRREACGVAPNVAPRLRDLGLFLPATPLQHLLLARGPALQVMTSGNVSGEPLAKDDDEAFAKLSAIADAFLVHDRAIEHRLDDSVVRIIAGVAQPIRRARGFVPEALPLPIAAPAVLAVGAEQKSTLCIASTGEAILSQHIGDLDHPETLACFESCARALVALTGITPVAVAHDLHPEYRSTRWARARGLPCEPVQHHHAHVASCLAEHGRVGPAIGIAFDGTGCGADGSLWGGEILAFDLAGFTRLGHLGTLALPGGEAAIREPWRIALGALVDAGEPLDAFAHIDEGRRRRLRALVEHRIQTPRATGAGRWFDAVASLCGLCDAVTYEGQAAALLEAIAAPDALPPYDFVLTDAAPFVADLRPMIRAVAHDRRHGIPIATISARFHETIARAITASCARVRAQRGLDVVAISGGCFQNRVLSERTQALLTASGFEVLCHRRVPPNDGGIAFGQAAVASFRLACAQKEAAPSCA
ncbi:[NiFe] hydrogenase metallocenter assembly protein HypF [Minicystis rosea]|nr:[NiFe] hydrogenase metallocenter assembly protein HypF [Minicystis rosea]